MGERKKKRTSRERMRKFAMEDLSAALSALIVCIPALRGIASAAEPAGTDAVPTMQRQINTIKADESAERRRVEKDERLIQELEQQLQQLESRDATLSGQTHALEVTNNKLKADTAQLQDSQKQRAAGLSDEQFGSAMNRYLGSHQFTWNGSVSGSFIYDRGNNTNTFALAFQPLVIYRLNDWDKTWIIRPGSRMDQASIRPCRSLWSGRPSTRLTTFR
jgi:TolA-binding protein